MPVGDPGQEQFRNMIMEMRNHHIGAGITPMMTMRSEVAHSEDLRDRGGFDTTAQEHFIQLLIRADKMRRRLTHNPDSANLGDKIARAIDSTADINDGANPFGGDDIQMGTNGQYQLPWDFSGADPDIPLSSALDLSNNGRILLLSIDIALVAWTRLNSRLRCSFITRFDSMRIYGCYQQILGYLVTFGGDENRTDVAQIEASDEPRGPANAPNRKTETAGGNAG
ncbi:MAG: hypothetical protein GY835_24585 [bacterium]|nr:hypothetical protein [bacterium]